MTSDGEMIDTKVIGLKEIYNFIADNFLLKIMYPPPKIQFKFLYLKNSKFSNGETIKTKVVVHNKIETFYLNLFTALNIYYNM